MNTENQNIVVEVDNNEVGYYYNNHEVQNQYVQMSNNNNQVRKMPTQLSEDEYALLMNNHEKGFTDISPEDLARAKCPHRTKNGANAFMADEDGNCTCSICGTKFQIVTDTNYVYNSIRGIKDSLNTIKVFYRYIPEEVLVTYTQFIPLLDNLAKLYDRAIKESEYSMVDPNMANQYLYNDNRNAFNALRDIMTSGYTNVPGYGAQGFGYAPAPNMNMAPQFDQYGNPIQQQFDQYGNPVMYQPAPSYNNMQPQPPQGGNNGWGWNQGMNTQQPAPQQPQPGANQWNFNGGAQQPPQGTVSGGAAPWSNNPPANPGLDTNMNK